jgi:hypothetical protein
VIDPGASAMGRARALQLTHATPMVIVADTYQVVNGPIEAAYEAAYRPLVQEDEKKLAQFDKMRKARDYVTLQGAYTMAGVAEDDEVQPKLPPIKVRRCA